MKITKRILSLLLAFMIPLSFIACSSEGTQSLSDDKTSASSNKATKGLEFTAQKDGTFAVSGYTGTSSKINIPAKHDGIAVTAIGENAFADSQIRSVSGGKNVVTIGEGAFSNCYMLQKFDISGDITTINSDAFCECTTLTEIDLPDTLTGLGYSAFQGCTSLETITIPKNLNVIRNSAFSGCTSLKAVEFSGGTTSIEYAAFQNCKALSELELPDTLNGIGTYSFAGCTSLKSITIPESVTYVDSEAFNTSLTITVMGSTSGWRSGWAGSKANVILEYENHSSPIVYVTPGRYTLVTDNEYIPEQYLYIYGDTLEWSSKSGVLWDTRLYQIHTEGNILHCIAKTDGYIDQDMLYDGESGCITIEYPLITYHFYLDNY